MDIIVNDGSGLRVNLNFDEKKDSDSAKAMWILEPIICDMLPGDELKIVREE